MTRRKKFFFTIASLVGAIVLAIAWYSLRLLILRHDYREESGILRSEHSVVLRADLLATGAREISFKSTDGVPLVGLYIPREKPIARMLLCHGYRQDKETFHDLVTLLPDIEFFLFDFRVHGQSKGHVVTFGYRESRDVRAAATVFHDLSIASHGAVIVDELPIVFLGVSMGAAAVVRALGAQPCIADGVVLDGMFCDFSREAAHVFTRKAGLPTVPFLQIMKFLRWWYTDVDIFAFKPIDYIDELSVPMLLIHSCIDATTPPSDALALYARARAKHLNARLWIAPPARHGYLWRDCKEEYARKVLRFVKRVAKIKSEQQLASKKLNTDAQG